MKITLITVGKIKEKFYIQAIEEYKKRLSKYCKLEILEVADEKTVENASDKLLDQIRDKEGKKILKILENINGFVITLEILGKELDSVEIGRAHV